MCSVINKLREEKELKVISENMGKSENINDIYIKAKFQIFENKVTLKVKEDYLLPQDKVKILGEDDYKSLNKFFLQVMEINNRYIGEQISNIIINLQSSNEIIGIKAEMQKIIERYCKERVKKINSKDKNIVDKSIRLLSELVFNIFNMLMHESSINIFFMEDIFYTIRNRFTFGVLNNPNDNTLFKLENLFKQNYDLEGYYKDYNLLLNGLQEYATKIAELKVFIEDRKYNIDIIKNIIELEFRFEPIQYVGVMTLNKNEKIIINSNGDFYDSEYYNTKQYYKDKDDIKYMQMNLFILKKVFEKLSTYTTIKDRAEITNKAVMEEYEKEDQKEDNRPIISHVPNEKSKKESLKYYNIKKNNSWQKFLKILKDNFNVVVDDGKGDEIKIYIKDSSDDEAKIYSAAAPSTRKREIFIRTQKSILKKIGISIDEWNEYQKINKLNNATIHKKEFNATLSKT